MIVPACPTAQPWVGPWKTIAIKRLPIVEGSCSAQLIPPLSV
jgi:hypothetical protein